MGTEPVRKFALPSAGLLLVAACSSGAEPVWEEPFDAGEAGFLSAVWGSGPDDVFIVGGNPDQGEVHHFDGERWEPMTEDLPPGTPLLVWVYGFGPDDVYAAGFDGAVVHYDGSDWSALDSGTDQDLWGIWGSAPDDIWFVGGSTAAEPPVILHHDGASFEPMALDPAENPLDVKSLFKVWGIGSKVFAVGQKGLVIEYDGSTWTRVSAGAEADEDFIALWGTNEENIVLVGGRAGGQIARYNGSSFDTVSPDSLGGVNGVFVEDESRAFIGGGFVGTVDLETLEVTVETATFDIVHALWGDGAGRIYAVGGTFGEPYRGFALVRTRK